MALSKRKDVYVIGELPDSSHAHIYGIKKNPKSHALMAALRENKIDFETVFRSDTALDQSQETSNIWKTNHSDKVTTCSFQTKSNDGKTTFQYGEQHWEIKNGIWTQIFAADANQTAFYPSKIRYHAGGNVDFEFNSLETFFCETHLPSQNENGKEILEFGFNKKKRLIRMVLPHIDPVLNFFKFRFNGPDTQDERNFVAYTRSKTVFGYDKTDSKRPQYALLIGNEKDPQLRRTLFRNYNKFLSKPENVANHFKRKFPLTALVAENLNDVFQFDFVHYGQQKAVQHQPEALH